jgi:hypothetical protein
MTILKTENEGYGFYGTIWTAFNSQTAADRAWELAFTKIQELTGMTPEQVLTFLDSRHGRHLADSAVSPFGYSDESVLAAVLEFNGYTYRGVNYIVAMTKLCR